jgi:hypothetical protein
LAPHRWTPQTRDVRGAWLAIDELREQIDGMRMADEVAERVKTEIEAHRMVGFTLVQKILGGLLGGLTAADLVLNILHASSHG